MWLKVIIPKFRLSSLKFTLLSYLNPLSLSTFLLCLSLPSVFNLRYLKYRLTVPNFQTLKPSCRSPGNKYRGPLPYLRFVMCFFCFLVLPYQKYLGFLMSSWRFKHTKPRIFVTFNVSDHQAFMIVTVWPSVSKFQS